MRRSVLRRTSALLAWALGVAACGEDLFTPLYGMPMADFDIDGTVVRAGTNETIAGIEVRFMGQPDTTDANGEWSFSDMSGGGCGPTCYVFARDIDGSEKGTYQDAEVEFTATQVSEGDGRWDAGEWEAHDITIEMSPENESPNH